MDLLAPAEQLNLYDKSWRIYSRHSALPPQYIGATAEIENSMITEGSVINGKVDFSVIFGGVTIEEGAKVQYSVVMPGTVIKAGAVVEYAIVGEDCVIGENAHVGRSPEEFEGASRDNWGIAVTGHRITVSEGKEVAPKQILSESI